MENGYEIELFFQNIHEIFYNFLGPKLPFVLKHSTMVTSPTEKGAVMIGGIKCQNYCSSDILELSGEDNGTLKWKILEQKLRHPRHSHISFSISNDIADTLITKSRDLRYKIKRK